MYYDRMNNSNIFAEQVRGTVEGCRKYVAFCNSLNNIGWNNPDAIYDAFEKELDLFSTCNHMPYQQAIVFRQAVVAACLARLCGFRL